MKGSRHAKKQLSLPTRFDTIPASDRRTDRRTCDDSICRASVASRGKNAADPCRSVQAALLMYSWYFVGMSNTYTFFNCVISVIIAHASTWLHRGRAFSCVCDGLFSGVTATPGAPAPPEGLRVLGPRPGQKKLFTFRLVIKRIKIYKILNFRCG